MYWKVSYIQKLSVECLQAEAMTESKIDKPPCPPGAEVLVNGRSEVPRENLGPLCSQRSHRICPHCPDCSAATPRHPCAFPYDPPPSFTVPTQPQGTLEFVTPDIDGLGVFHPD